MKLAPSPDPIRSMPLELNSRSPIEWELNCWHQLLTRTAWGGFNGWSVAGVGDGVWLATPVAGSIRILATRPLAMQSAKLGGCSLQTSEPSASWDPGSGFAGAVP